MKFINSLILIFTAIFLLSFRAALAQQYGTTEQAPSKSISIDKLVSTSQTSKGGTVDFVDNLSPTDPRFAPGNQIFFKLKVKNTSDVQLNNVVVEDFLPADVNLVEGQAAINIGTLNAGEEKEYTLKVQVKTQNQLPTDRGIWCEINRARVTADNAQEDEDTAQFCIEKQVANVSTVPTAGPEMGMALLGLEGAALGIGIYLKKKLS